VAQLGGERPGASGTIAFRPAIERLRANHGSAGLYDLLAQLDAEPRRFQAELPIIAKTIHAGPVSYASGDATPIFATLPPLRQPARIEESFGWVSMHEQVWLDISRFDHWIEDSVVLRWAHLTARMNRADEADVGRYLGMLLQVPGADRTTTEARQFLRAAGAPTCVWTEARLSESSTSTVLFPTPCGATTTSGTCCRRPAISTFARAICSPAAPCSSRGAPRSPPAEAPIWRPRLPASTSRSAAPSAATHRVAAGRTRPSPGSRRPSSASPPRRASPAGSPELPRRGRRARAVMKAVLKSTAMPR
jgi:hypothetical protein